MPDTIPGTGLVLNICIDWGIKFGEQPTGKDAGVLVDDKLHLTQYALAAKRNKCTLECIGHITSWSREEIVLFYSALVQPHFEHCVV